MKSLAALLLASAALLTVGCSNPDDVSYGGIVGDLSPELLGSTERGVDRNRNVNLSHDMNTRLFWDDLGRAFYTDHPSRLSPLPITGTSGKSR